MRLLGRGFPRIKMILYGREGDTNCWLLTPFGIPIAGCSYKWIDEEVWEDSWFWTD
jgi:hypothetical protein